MAGLKIEYLVNYDGDERECLVSLHDEHGNYAIIASGINETRAVVYRQAEANLRALADVCEKRSRGAKT